jgi:hypothetical protein
MLRRSAGQMSAAAVVNFLLFPFAGEEGAKSERWQAVSSRFQFVCAYPLGIRLFHVQPISAISG